MNRFSLCALTVLSLLASAATSHAVVLDWDAISWTAGSLNNSYDIDPSRPGNDLTIGVVANAGAPFQNLNVSPGSMTPANAAVFQGGLASTQNTLCIALNLTSNSQSVTVNVSFSSLYAAGVSNVSFTIFDIDYANAAGNTYQDQLTLIRGVALDGSLVAPTITTSSANTRTGTGINQVVTGTGSVSDTGGTSGNGNVTISFGTNVITGFTFTYGSGTAFSNPTYQHIGIHDISFTPVPELNPALGSAFSCLAALGFVFLRHRTGARK